MEISILDYFGWHGAYMSSCMHTCTHTDAANVVVPIMYLDFYLEQAEQHTDTSTLPVAVVRQSIKERATFFIESALQGTSHATPSAPMLTMCRLPLHHGIQAVVDRSSRRHSRARHAQHEPGVVGQPAGRIRHHLPASQPVRAVHGQVRRSTCMVEVITCLPCRMYYQAKGMLTSPTTAHAAAAEIEAAIPMEPLHHTRSKKKSPM